MSRLKSFQLAVCTALLVGIGLFGMPAFAGPLITYQLSLTIESVDIPSSYDIDGYSKNPYYYFGIVAPGQTFVGSFGVDAGILASDGIVNTAPVYDFRLPFGVALYSNGPDNLTLLGFRNPWVGANAPGFRILDGDVVDLVGGVYGTGDVPFIDFGGYANISPNHFSALDSGGLLALGSLIVSRLPEPSTYALTLAGLGVLGLVARRRKPQAV